TRGRDCGSRARHERILVMERVHPSRWSRRRETSASPTRPISSPTSDPPLIIRCWDTVFLIGPYAAGSAPLFGEVVRLVEPEEAEAPSWSSVSLSALSSASVSSAFSPGDRKSVVLF